jgi:2',3'-cyclic-nucleotide 2'-phosphodiesterase (5'-nucleotidase family)
MPPSIPGLRVPVAALAAAALLLPLGGARPASAAAGTVTILSTGATNGEITTCGCAKKMLGGIDKRPSVIKTVGSKGDPVLVLDAGDIGDRKGDATWKKTEFLWDQMARMGYDAVTPGEMELIEGLDGLKALYASHPEVQAVSANLRTKDSTLVLPEMRSKADLVVALLHVGAGDAKRLLGEVSGIDVAILGHNPGYSFEPEKIGNTVVVRGGERGQYMFALQVTAAAGGGVARYEGEGKPLGELVAKDPAFSPAVAKWIEKHPEDKPPPGY